MSRIARSQYVIDKSNTNYINAIATYNKFVHIQSINYKDVSDQGYSCADLLTKVIPTIRGEEFGIEAVSANSASSMGALPPLNAERLLSAMPAALTAIELEAGPAIYKHIQWYINALERRGGYEVFIGPLERLPAFSESQAIWLVDQIHKEFPTHGAMMFHSQNAIVVQHGFRNFILRYGDKPFFGELQDLTLDLDDGFNMRTDLSERDVAIGEALQTHFLPWKASNYTGPLIAPEQSGFRYGQANVAVNTISVAMSGLGLHQPASRLAPPDDPMEETISRRP